MQNVVFLRFLPRAPVFLHLPTFEALELLTFNKAAACGSLQQLAAASRFKLMVGFFQPQQLPKLTAEDMAGTVCFCFEDFVETVHAMESETRCLQNIETHCQYVRRHVPTHDLFSTCTIAWLCVSISPKSGCVGCKLSHGRGQAMTGLTGQKGAENRQGERKNAMEKDFRGHKAPGLRLKAKQCLKKATG